MLENLHIKLRAKNTQKNKEKINMQINKHSKTK